MENNPKKRQETPKSGKKRKLTNLEWTLIFVAGVLFLVLAAMLILKPFFEIPDITPPTDPSTQAPTELMHYQRTVFTELEPII